MATAKKNSFTKEFLLFLKEYKVASLAVAFIMGEASTGLVQSLVNDIILPFAAPFTSAETWREATLTIGPVKLSYGSFIADILNFAILAFIVFIVARKIIKLEQKEK